MPLFTLKSALVEPPSWIFLREKPGESIGINAREGGRDEKFASVQLQPRGRSMLAPGNTYLNNGCKV